ncbi:MAG TPA: hypothetical protein VK602_13825, partial [Phyllobacterium sp.]|nr:hypothetical protein [Phyllobacterium sp.]
MKRSQIFSAASAGILLLFSSDIAFAAANNDPSWPCVQRKVPELSVGQVWSGPEIPEAAKNWDTDPKVDDLVGELAARRNPLDVAQKQIVEFAGGLPKDQVNDKMFMLFQ